MTNNTSFYSPDVVLVDGNALMYASYFAMPNLSSPSGEPTGAIKGFDNTVKLLYNRFKTKKFIMIFDAKGKSFRSEISPDYKATRNPTPSNLILQIEKIHHLSKLLGFPVIVHKGVEADDVIGTLAKQAGDKKLITLIITPDKDMNQLVNNFVHIYNPRTNNWLNSQSIFDKYGVMPYQFIDYLSLIGDKSDNIAGIDKVGPKTAKNMLQKYINIEGIYENIDYVNDRVKINLKAGIDKLKTSKELVTIKLDIDLDIEDYAMQEIEENTLQEFYDNHGFNTAKSTKDTLPKNNSANIQTKIIVDKNELENIENKIKSENIFAIDVVFIEESSWKKKLVGFSIFPKNSDSVFYIPVSHESDDLHNEQINDLLTKQIDKKTCVDFLQKLFENKDIECVSYDTKTNNYCLEIDIAKKISEISLLAYVVDGNTKNKLENLASKYTQIPLVNLEDVLGKGRNKVDFNFANPFKVADYSKQRVCAIFEIYSQFIPKITKNPQLNELLTDVELPLIPVLLKMEKNGSKIDTKILQKHSSYLQEKIDILQENIFLASGSEFNISSPKQLGEVLFTKMGITSSKKTSKSAMSTSESVLRQIAKKHPIANDILSFRSASKLKSTYTDKLTTITDTQNRIHTQFNQAIVVTGRLSSSNPNLQNIPIRTDDGSHIRSAFVVEDGYKMVCADYSQIELRIIAHLADEKTMISDFNNGHDIHKATASKVFDIALEEITTEQRRRAKAINFGIIYGISAFGLATQLDIARYEAQEIIDAYLEKYKSIINYMDITKEQAEKDGYVQTIYNRKINIAGIDSPNSMIKSGAQRLAINAPIQGSAADIIKKSMLKIDQYLTSSGINARMILQVHDELIFEVKEECVEEFCMQIKDIMQKIASLSVELLVDIGVGDSWKEAH